MTTGRETLGSNIATIHKENCATIRILIKKKKKKESSQHVMGYVNLKNKRGLWSLYNCFKILNEVALLRLHAGY